ncbi:TauD/TfdA family dioxygenase [Acidocella sp.]|uniref:TauD/TfdA dioxygenase family protein n=1 Tax=Acidocella sp. TaxID=50710 RepID=UPI00262EF979|nr:TauD/TfdA family dioxygenase [Acidocella sp.]
MDMNVDAIRVEVIKPEIGAVLHVDRAALCEPAVAARIMELLELHDALIFPRLKLTDEEQVAFTGALGALVNFTHTAPGGSKANDVYEITLDKKKNPEPEYVLGTFFWHMDGTTINQPVPKASVLSCRKTSPKGGQTQFCNTYAAYEALPEDEKKALEGLRVMHSVVAAVREVAAPEDLEPFKRGAAHEQPLVWTRKNGRKSLMIGYSADYIVGWSKAEGRALLARLQEWAAQPRFCYSHEWQEGDLAIWDNGGALHRVIPYPADSGRTMHRTSIAGLEATS